MPPPFDRTHRGARCDVNSRSWCGHKWSEWMPPASAAAQVRRGALGLYRIRGNDRALLYIGEGSIGPRLATHLQTARKRTSEQGSVSAAGEPLECSWVENTTCATHQRLELETDLIAAYVEAHQCSPAGQFLA